MEMVQGWMEWAAFALDIVAIAIIVGGAVIAAVRCNLIGIVFRLDDSERISSYKRQLVNALLLGLDLLVASDVIKTTALEFTLYNVATLGLLVIIRITLSWSLVVEAEGRWPWQSVSGSVEADKEGGREE
ncbi:MAG: DUF1622 domain-containing protein [Acidobacteriota bacterium]